jgi:hypothetical protein
MLAWMTALAWLAVCQESRPGADRHADDPLDVPQMFVPFDQIDKFRDPTATYQSMRYDEFLELLRSADAAWRARRFVGPTAGTITGRVDLDERRVFGTSTWSFPKGHNGSVELWPWNLRVLAVREQGRTARPDWGLTSDGALLVRNLPSDARQIDVDWELPGEPLNRRWTIRGQTPKCASSRIRLDYPSNWEAWAPASFEATSLSADSKRIETRSSGESSWTIELAPAGLIDAERSLLSWRGESLFRFGPVRTDVELRAVVQIDRERTPRIRLRLPPALNRLSLSTVGATANWRRTALPNGGMEWTAEFRRPPIGSVQLVASGSLPTPTGEQWALESFAVPDALFRGERIEIVVDPALRLLNVDPAALVQKDFRVEGNVGRWQFVGFAGERRPSVHFGESRSEIEVQSRHFLDVGRERVRLAARFDWSCIRGESSTPTFLAPAGWRLQKASVEPAARARTEPSTETNDDGRLRIAVPLTRPLTTGEKVQVELQFERPSAGWTPASGESELLPEIVAPGTVSVGPTNYSVRIDLSLPLRLAGDDPRWTVAANTAGAAPTTWNWDGDVARFRYAPPLAKASLRGVESQRLVFDADVLHVVQERTSGWDLRTAFTIHVRAGDVGWVELEASRPVPPDARWTSNGVDDASDDVQVQPSPQQPERTRYRLPLRAGTDGRATMQAVWRSNESIVEPIAFRFPEADRTNVRAIVLSPESRRVQVASKGWVEADVERETGEVVDAKSLRWSGRVERSDGAATLRVRRAEAPADGARGGEVAGMIDVSGPRHRRVFHASLQLESSETAPINLVVPAGAKLWTAALDGQPVAAWIHAAEGEQGAIVLSEPVPPGRHRLDVLFHASVSARDEAATPSVQAPWRSNRILWRIAAADAALQPGSDPQLLGALRWRPNSEALSLERQADSIARGTSDEVGFTVRRAARLLRTSPETIGVDQANDLSDALLLLQRRLPEGWIIVVERFAVDAAHRARSSGGPFRSVEDWLKSIGLHPTLGANVLLLTGRPLAEALERNGTRIAPQAFAESKANALRANGVEPWGAFAAISQWRGSEESLDREIPIPTNDSVDESTTLYVLGDGKPLDLLATNGTAVSALAIAGFCVGAIAAIAAMFVGRRANILAGLLGGAAAAFLLGVALGQGGGSVLTSFAWGITTATLGGMLHLLAERLRKPAVAIILASLLANSSKAADEPTALVPFDPGRLDAPLASVDVPEPLLRRLRSLAEGRATPFLLTSADYQGQVVRDLVEWKATLTLLVLGKEPPIKAPIGFIGVDVQSIEVDGKPIGFLAPTATLPLVATLSPTPKQVLNLRFRTPIASVDQGSMVEFPLPAAAQQSFTIAGFAKAIDLVRTPESKGFSLKSEAGGVRIVGARGPSPILQVIWRKRTAETPVAKAQSAASLRAEGKSGAWEMQTHFQWEPATGTRELIVPIPQGVVVRRLEGHGLASWTTSTSTAGVPQVKASIGPGPGGLTIHSWFLPRDPKNFSPPLLFPDGVAVQGVVGIALPNDAGLEIAAGRGVAELGGPEFRDAWRRAANDQPPETPTKAFAISDRDHAIAVQAQPSAESWRMGQEHSLRVAPHGSAAAWSGTFHFAATDPVDVAVISIPAGFKIDRVDSESLFQWFRVGDEMVLRFSKPLTGEWSAEATGRYEFPAGAGNPPATLKPFLPLVGAAASCQWTLGGEKGVGIEFVREPPATCIVQRAKDETRVEGPTDDASLEIKLTHAASKLLVRQGVLVGRGNGEWVCQGLLELRCEGSRATPWEILTPRSLGSIEWSTPGLRVIDAGVRETYRRWLVEPRTADADSVDRFALRWRATPAAEHPDGRRVLDTPVILVPAAASSEIWLAQTSTDRVEPTTQGYTAERIPDWLQAMAVGLTNDQNLNVWRTNDPASKITFAAPKESAPTTPPKVHGWVDVSVARSGRCRGRTVWWVAGGGGRINVALPSGCEVLALRVEGRASASVSPGEETLPVRLDGRARPTQVELEWSAPGLALPAVRDAEVGPTLLRLRSPFGFETTTESVGRAEWLARLLSRECEAWLARAAGRSPEPEDRIGLAYLYQMARESAGGEALEVERIWSTFIDKATAARGEETAQRLANLSGVGEFTGPQQNVAEVDAVVDHFDYAGTVVLPTALDSPRQESTPQRSRIPWAFLTTLTIAGGLAWLLAKRFPDAVPAE